MPIPLRFITQARWLMSPCHAACFLGRHRGVGRTQLLVRVMWEWAAFPSLARFELCSTWRRGNAEDSHPTHEPWCSLRFMPFSGLSPGTLNIRDFPMSWMDFKGFVKKKNKKKYLECFKCWISWISQLLQVNQNVEICSSTSKRKSEKINI